MKSNILSDQMQEYVHFLRTQIKQFGAQIDFEFERSSSLIFRYHENYVVSTNIYTLQVNVLVKRQLSTTVFHSLKLELSSLGVQWNLQNQFEAKL